MGNLKAKRNYRRTVLRLPDLDHSKAGVLNSLSSPGSRRVYRYAIEQFIAWYCSEPRLAFNRIVAVRYRMYLEGRGLAANTINQQLAAVRRLAHEAADAGLLSPELAAGISGVKGVKQLGFRSCGDPYINWDKVKTKEDIGPFMCHRDQWYAQVVKDEVLAKHHRAFLIAGATHFLRGQGDPNRPQGVQQDHRKRHNSWSSPGTLNLNCGGPEQKPS